MSENIKEQLTSEDEVEGNPRRYLTKKEISSIQAHHSFDAIVIGSGVGGMVCAAFLAKAARKKVLVLEKHKTVGGCTHTFEAGPDKVEFDVGVHYVGGGVWKASEPRSTNRILFDYLSEGRLKWRQLDDVYDIAVINGQKFPIRSGKEKQIEDLVKWFPRETGHILEYWRRIEKASEAFSGYVMYQIMSAYVPNFLSGLSEPWILKQFHRFSDMTVEQMLDQIGFQDDTLRALLCYDYGNYGLPPSKATWITHAAVVSHYVGGSGYPIGGSSAFAKSFIPTIEKHGGAVFSMAGVSEIMTNSSGVVQGVRLQKGEEIKCSTVISAIGAWNTFNRLVKPQVHSNDLLKRIQLQTNSLLESPAHIVLFGEIDGESRELGLPAANIWVEPGNKLSDLVEDYEKSNGESDFPAVFISFPSSKDPDTWKKNFPGKSVLEVVVTGNVEWFSKWEHEPTKHRSSDYVELKKKLSDRMMNIVYEQFPQLKGKVTVTEVGTPLSSIHNLNSHRGVSYGLGCSTDRYRQTDWLRPDAGGAIKGLYLTGQDVVCNGIQGSLMAGVVTASSISFAAAREARALLAVGSVGLGVGDDFIRKDVEEGLDDLEFEDELGLE